MEAHNSGSLTVRFKLRYESPALLSNITSGEKHTVGEVGVAAVDARLRLNL